MMNIWAMGVDEPRYAEIKTSAECKANTVKGRKAHTSARVPDVAHWNGFCFILQTLHLRSSRLTLVIPISTS
jgi:hypothetical protein